MQRVSPLSNDWAVLCQLELAGRATYSEIGRSLGMSKEGVMRSVLRLERKGIISQYITVINTACFGLTSFVVYVQLHPNTRDKRQSILKKLCSYPDVYWVSRMGGRFDLLFAISVASVRDFSARLENINISCGALFARVVVNTRIQTVQFPRNYLSDRAPSRRSVSPRKPLSFGHRPEIIDIDPIDLRLLNTISAEARMPVADIAREIGVPRTTVQRRLALLEERKIIQGYAANVKAEILGYQIYRILITTLTKGASVHQRLYEFARSQPNITFIDFGMGEWDVELTCEVISQQELQNIQDELGAAIKEQIQELEILPVFEDNLKFQFTV